MRSSGQEERRARSIAKDKKGRNGTKSAALLSGSALMHTTNQPSMALSWALLVVPCALDAAMLPWLHATCDLRPTLPCDSSCSINHYKDSTSPPRWTELTSALPVPTFGCMNVKPPVSQRSLVVPATVIAWYGAVDVDYCCRIDRAALVLVVGSTTVGSLRLNIAYLPLHT